MFKAKLQKVFYTVTNNETGETDWEEDVITVCPNCGAEVDHWDTLSNCPHCRHRDPEK